MEDPRIWDDPKRAQELGREKKSLEDIVLVLEAVDNGINDGRELFAMGKDDDDEDTLLSVEADNAGLEAEARRPRIPPHVQQPVRPDAPASWKSRPAPAAPKPRTGRRCCCACT